MTQKAINELTYRIVGTAITVHRELGAGLLESVYHKCMREELFHAGLSFRSEMPVQVIYKSQKIETDLRCDFFVEEKIAVELKAVDAIAPVHEAQVLTYMKLLKSPKGILFNFNCANIFKEGQRTFVNELYKMLPQQ